MKNNGNRILETIRHRDMKTTESVITRNMKYTNGAWNDTHRY